METRKVLFAVICIITLSLKLGTWNCFAQTPGEWTWMHGDNIPNSPGVFGIQGVPDPANTPPALYEPCEWKDNNGNFWLFGGTNATDVYAALWKYDPVTNQWTWMKGPSAVNQNGFYGTQGTSSPGNYPGSRGWAAATWVDASGNLWLFGGGGYASAGGQGSLNDLWKYDIAANEWTWVKGPNTINDPGSYGVQGISGPANLPSSRSETSCTWTDNMGNLWMYGGDDATGSLNDLWKYNIATNAWTWMHGANTGNPPPVYGTQGIASPANTPGARQVWCSWTDLSGNLWLFGGKIVTVLFGELNDLWKYDIATNQWTWMKGSNTTHDPGSYGTKCVSSTTNVPPARFENRARIRDICGNFWCIGGSHYNDLWHYNVSNNQWTWVSGDNTPQAAVYGSKGLSSPATKPGGRIGNVSWMDSNGYIWVFGGQGVGYFNDLFRYAPPVLTVSADTTICIGQSATLTASSCGMEYVWSPGGQTTSGIVVNPATSTTYTVTSSCGLKTASVTVTVSPITPISASSNTTICSGQEAILTASGGTSYSWLPGGQSTSGITVNPTAATTYTVIGSNACVSDTVSITVAVHLSPTATASSTNALCMGSSDGTAAVETAGGTPSYTYLWSNGATTSHISNLIAQTYTITVTDANGCTHMQAVTVGSDAIMGEPYLPNAFSPNGDEENDVLQIYYSNMQCIKSFKLSIYNRWGERIFVTTDINKGWDGKHKEKIENAAVFAYYLEVTMMDGKEISRQGNISLIK